MILNNRMFLIEWCIRNAKPKKRLQWQLFPLIYNFSILTVFTYCVKSMVKKHRVSRTLFWNSNISVKLPINLQESYLIITPSFFATYASEYISPLFHSVSNKLPDQSSVRYSSTPFFQGISIESIK